MSHRISRVGLSVPIAVLLSLLIASQALAGHLWGTGFPLSSSGAGFGKGIVGLNSTTAVATYVEWNGTSYDVNVRRSTDGGDSFDAPLTLSTNGYPAAIAGLDPFVDVVWSQNGRVKYARSVNGAVSFSPSMRLSTNGFAINLSVARGPGGLVIVAWQNGNTNVVKTRVSTDGGVTFGAATIFPTSVQDMGTSVAAGTGVVYLAYKLTTGQLRARTSIDGGVTWSTEFIVTDDGYGVDDQFDFTADGTTAYLAYTVNNVYQPGFGAVRYRRTTDSGLNWSGERNLAPPKQQTEFPEILVQGSVVRAVYARRFNTYHVVYHQSVDGVNWKAPEPLNTGHDPYVAYAGKIDVMYEVGTGDSYVRTGTPP